MIWFTRPSPSLQPPSIAGRAFWRGRGRGGEGGAKSYDDEKAWSPINRSILFVKNQWKSVSLWIGLLSKEKCSLLLIALYSTVHLLFSECYIHNSEWGCGGRIQYVYLDIDGKLIFSFDYYDYIIKKKTIRLYSQGTLSSGSLILWECVSEDFITFFYFYSPKSAIFYCSSVSRLTDHTQTVGGNRFKYLFNAW